MTSPSPSLAQQAFTVYRDHTLKDATEKNAQLRVENGTMEAAGGILTKIQCYFDSYDNNTTTIGGAAAEEVVGEGNGQNNTTMTSTMYKEIDLCHDTPDREDATHLVYYVGNEKTNHHTSAAAATTTTTTTPAEVFAPSVPLEHIKEQRFFVAGYRVPDDLYSLTPTRLALADFLVNEQDETIHMKVVGAANLITVTGTLTHYAGSFRQLQQIIADREILIWYMNVGRLSPGALVPCGQLLVGAIFTPKEVSIDKEGVLQRTLDLLGRENDANASDDGELPEYAAYLGDLMKLTDVAPGNDRVLGQAVATGKTLAHRNQSLKACRDLLRTVEVYSSSETDYFFGGGAGTLTPLFQMNLEDGDLVSGPAGENPMWLLKPTDESMSIPLASIPKVVIKVANMGTGVWPSEYRTYKWTEQLLLFVQGGGSSFNAFAVFFAPDDSWSNLDLDQASQYNVSIRELMDKLYRGEVSGAVMEGGVPISVTESLENTGIMHLSMRPAMIMIPLENIRGALNALGIETGSETE